MFQRRLKILLVLLLAATGLLIARALQIQVLQHQQWQSRAAESLRRYRLTDTTRGSILDLHGREIAVDQACIDACVDYRAIVREPDPAWLRAKAQERLSGRLGKLPKAERNRLIEQEMQSVKTDIEVMWLTLARESGKPTEQLDDIRRSIVQRVEMRRRYLWYYRYRKALAEREKSETAPWYKQWLVGGLDEQPQIDSFAEDVAEQTDAHVVLRAISAETNAKLAKNIERYPGLVLRPSTHRVYPYGDAACHLIGYLSRVTKEDLQADDNLGTDELRQYYPNDLIGRSGLEALCEPSLRGARGREERVLGQAQIVSEQPSAAGQDVRTTIDIELQAQMQELFRHSRTVGADGAVHEHEMHGSAVVIDIASGQVRALVSYPTFDLNELETKYSELAADAINQRLLNRATQYPLEPGSTIKPVAGIAAIAEGALGPHEGIECTGYLVLRGRKYSVGRCWVASKYAAQFGDEGVKHHPFPVPHRGTHGNTDGFLTYSDALERSCNVFFETVADRLGTERLSTWYGRFGLGRPTGLGIAEAPGRLPSSYDGPASGRLMTLWMSGIGQGQVAATPIQMANIAATVARDGIWLRPLLVAAGTRVAEEKLRDAQGQRIPDRVDLRVPEVALSEARAGMIRVVNSESGTGDNLRRNDVLVAGKTGTAQAARFSVPRRGDDGALLRDEDGHVQREFLEPSNSRWVNPQAPWYWGTGADEKHLNHAWYIGFAPAQKPQIAFAVVVEYGGSGGVTAAGIAKQVLEACVEHGYLALDRNLAGVGR